MKWHNRCLHCEEPLDGEDVIESLPHFDGENWTIRGHHRDCAMRAVIGGLNHLLGHCTCCGGDQPPDPPGLTRREAASVAVAWWERSKGRAG